MVQVALGETVQGFRKAVESLKLFQRAELIDEETEESLIEKLYVDPKPNDEVLRTLRSPNTTLLIGRKGIGKSTIFQRLQHDLRASKDTICVYIDIKTVFAESEIEHIAKRLENFADTTVDVGFASQISLAHSFISLTVTSLIDELTKRAGESFYHQLKNSIFKKKDKAIEQIRELMDINRYMVELDISTLHLSIRETASKKTKAVAHSHNGSIRIASIPNATVGATTGNGEMTSRAVATNVQETLLRRFNFRNFTTDLKQVLQQVGIKRVYIIIDDFSELPQDAMKVFVSNILAPLNNSANEIVKFKIAAYPGRIYLGDIDKTKIDEILLDHYDLYGGHNIALMEERATDFIQRLLNKRIRHFCGMPPEHFFEDNASEVWRELYCASSANPRILGYILHYAMQEQLAYQRRITVNSIRDAAERYFSEKIEESFFTARFAHQSFAEQSSIMTLKRLVEAIVARSVKLKTYDGTEAFRAFKGDAPTSHFHIQKRLETALATLDMNGFVTKYSERRDKDGRIASIYSLNCGLCHKAKIKYGTAGAGEFSQLIRERVLDYTTLIEEFLSENEQIRCGSCGHEESRENLEALRLYKMRCPNCGVGVMEVHCSKPPSKPIEIPTDLVLSEFSLKILGVLNSEGDPMFAADIAAELDCSPRQVGNSAKILLERGLVEKSQKKGKSNYSLTEKARSIYFNEAEREMIAITATHAGRA